MTSLQTDQKSSSSPLLHGKMPRDHSTFIKSFFVPSDNPTAHAEYVGLPAPDATLIIGLKRAAAKGGKDKCFPPRFEFTGLLTRRAAEIKALREAEHGGVWLRDTTS